MDTSHTTSSPVSSAPAPGHASTSRMAGTTGSGMKPRLSSAPPSRAGSVPLVLSTATQSTPSCVAPKSTGAKPGSAGSAPSTSTT